MAELGRDRDTGGRARNARPRDAAGRPLPRGATGVPRVSEDLLLAPAEALAEADRLLQAGSPFAAHEVLEGAWKAAAPAERSLWQGLAQLAVGLTHAQRGNATGAVALLRRGRRRIEPYAARPPYGIAVARLLAAADALADRIETAGLAAVRDEDLRLRLTGAEYNADAAVLRSDPTTDER